MSEDMPWVIGLSDEEVQELRSKKQELTEYGKQKIRELMDKDLTHEEMLEVAAQRESENKALEALDKLYDENGEGMKQLAEIERNETIVAKVSDEDLEKVMDAAARQELAKKSFEELTRDERIKLALEEVDWIVIGGQDGQEFYGSIQFIRKVLKSFR